MARVAYHDTGIRYGKDTAPVKSKTYLAWLRSLPCIVSGTQAEAAHVSFPAPEWGAPGRGKGRKVSDRFALPLSPDEHRKQHTMSEPEYWRSVGIDPHKAACILYGIWSERGDDGLSQAVRLILTGAFETTGDQI
tara:strand:- start:1657 stop:2061 length:405 start_codon:yes stop_codon:yes gene_type:complete